MRGFLHLLGAQVSAEVRMRLRSPATAVALAAMIAGTTIWIPSASGRAVSMTWETPSGAVQAPLYTSGALGVSVAVFGGVFLMLAGWYLVAGSVRRDRERGVGAILAATPLSNEAYLVGKFAAHAAYLAVLAILVLAVGTARFLLEGVGPLRPASLAAPLVILGVPSILFTAAMAVLFDVTPGLRGRGGLVAWFFAFGILVSIAAVPNREKLSRGRPSFPLFDPSGGGTLEQLVVASLPQAKPGSVGTGHIVLEKPPERVPWKGIELSGRLIGARALALLWCLPPLLLAFLLFDRFDPSKGKRGGRSLADRLKGRIPGAADAPAIAASRVPTPLGIAPSPGFLRAAAAEALLLWQGGGLLRWPLAAASLAAFFVPASALTGFAAAWLVLLIPAVSEAAAREDLFGTRALVFSQPGVPRSPVVWKAAAIGLFLFALGLPFLARFSSVSPARGAAFAAGLLFVAGFSAGAGALSRGGKLFSALYLALWYAGLNGLREADYCGAFRGAPGIAASILYMAVGAAWVAAARVAERRVR